MTDASTFGLRPPDAPPKSSAATFGLVAPDAAQTTLPGLAASAARGAAPYAAGAALGAALGAPFGGVGAVPGALAGIGATALTQFGGDIYNLVGAPFGHFLTPEEATDKAFDALGIKRPATAAEEATKAGAGFAASMAGVPVQPAETAKAAHALAQDFEAHGVSPTIPAVGQGPITGRAANLLKSAPLAASVVRDAITRSLNETAAAVQRGARLFGEARDPEEAGSAVRNAMRRFAEDESEAQKNYGVFWRLMEGAAPAAMPNTTRVVNELMGQFPNAPELEGWATQAPVARLREALREKTVTRPAVTSRILDASGMPIVVRAAETVTRSPRLSMSEIRLLRSQIGRLIGQPAIGPEAIPRAELRRLYGALTDDMRMAAKARSSAAAKALENANAAYGIRLRLLDVLRPLAEQRNPAQAFKALNSAASAGASNAGLLRAARKVMTPQEWGDLGATVVARLGEPTPGIRDVLADTNFSPSSFVTNWNRLSDKAKDLLFGFNEAGTPRAGLEALARISQAQKNVASLANTSRTAEHLLMGGAGVEMLREAYQALGRGHLGEMIGIPAALGTGYGFAKFLMSPRVARWLYALPRIKATTPAAKAQIAVNALVAAMSEPSQ